MWSALLLAAATLGAAPAPSSAPKAPPQRIAYLEGAERVLVLLLRRLGKGLLGVLFRRRKSFRTLQERYL